MSEYIIIKNLHADNVNFEQNFCVIGNFPAITSFVGLVHAGFRKLEDIKDLSICPILHNAETYMGIEKSVPELAKIKKNEGAPLAQTVKGSVDFSLIIKIQYRKERNIDNINDEVYKAFYGLTLAGGVLNFDKKNISYVREDDFNEEIRHIRNGKIISDATELLFLENSSEDKLEELIDIISIKKDEKGNFLPKKHEGFLIPIAIGYAGLEFETIRGGRKGENNHCFSECVTGLGSVLNFSKNKINKIFAKKVFWQYSYDKSTESFLCVGCEKN